MRAWEYYQEVVPLPKNTSRANELGAEGWELVSAVGPLMTAASVVDTGPNVPGLILTFKRPAAQGRQAERCPPTFNGVIGGY